MWKFRSPCRNTAAMIRAYMGLLYQDGASTPVDWIILSITCIRLFRCIGRIRRILTNSERSQKEHSCSLRRGIPYFSYQLTILKIAALQGWGRPGFEKRPQLEHPLSHSSNFVDSLEEGGTPALLRHKFSWSNLI